MTAVRINSTSEAVSVLPRTDPQLGIDPDPELEQEAEETAQRVMQGCELGIQRMNDSDVHVQRDTRNSQTQNLVASTRPGRDEEAWETTGETVEEPSLDERVKEIESELDTLQQEVASNSMALGQVTEGGFEDESMGLSEGELAEMTGGEADGDDSRGLRDRLSDGLQQIDLRESEGRMNLVQGAVAGGITAAGVGATIATGGTAAAIPAAVTIAGATAAPLARNFASESAVTDDTEETEMPDQLINEITEQVKKELREESDATKSSDEEEESGGRLSEFFS